MLLARFASCVTPQIAFGSGETRFALSATTIFLSRGSFVACTDAMRAAISHASFTVETNLASLGALAFLITLIVLAILWARLAYPLAAGHFLKEREAARNTRFRFASFAIASFWPSAFWASFITHVSTPARVATIFTLAVLLVAATTFAPAGACFFALLSKETVLTIAFAKAICLVALIVFASLRTLVFASLSPEFEVLTLKALAILFLTAWHFRCLDAKQTRNCLRAIARTWLVAPQSVIVNLALLWACSCREEGLAIWGTNQVVIERAVWAVLRALLIALSAVVA